LKSTANQSARGNHILSLSEKFARVIPSGQFTAADITNYLMDFKDDPDAAVEKANDWVMYKKEAVMP
jgi:proline dehydrogenase